MYLLCFCEWEKIGTKTVGLLRRLKDSYPTPMIMGRSSLIYVCYEQGLE